MSALGNGYGRPIAWASPAQFPSAYELAAIAAGNCAYGLAGAPDAAVAAVSQWVLAVGTANG